MSSSNASSCPTACFPVALTRCDDYEPAAVRTALQRQFELLGGLDRFVGRGDHVLVKPNMLGPLPPERAVQTHPVVIVETARLLKDFGARPFVADSPAWSTLGHCAAVLGLSEPLARLGVPLRPLARRRRQLVGNARLGLSQAALDADAIVNLPKFKMHQQLTATLAVKNLYGCVVGKEKAFWHYARGKDRVVFCTMLLHLYRRLNPVINLVDAVLAMEGPGPINGTPRPLRCLVGASDPIACEMLCAELIDLPCDALPMVVAARRLAFGCPAPTALDRRGDDPAALCRPDFVRPGQIALQFSLNRVCKSIIAQALARLRAAFGRPVQPPPPPPRPGS